MAKKEAVKDGFVALVGEIENYSKANSRGKNKVESKKVERRVILPKSEEKRIAVLKSQGFKEE